MIYAVDLKGKRSAIDFAGSRCDSTLEAQLLGFLETSGHMRGSTDGTRQRDFSEVDVIRRERNTGK